MPRWSAIVHGWNDLSCPFMASVLTVDREALIALR
jgi:hypothetical protein